LSVEDDRVLWGSRVMIPPQGCSRVMDDCHPGVSHMKSLARSYTWWPNMDKDIEEKARSCATCQSCLKMPSGYPPVHNRNCSRRTPHGSSHLHTFGFIYSTQTFIRRSSRNKLSRNRIVMSMCKTPVTAVWNTVYVRIWARPKVATWGACGT